MSPSALSTIMEVELPISIRQVLAARGFVAPEAIDALLSPSLDALGAVERFPHMAKAVERLRRAIAAEETIGLYADRDVDGLTGLVILVRTLRTLGGNVVWASPLQGRGVQREILAPLVEQQAKTMIFVDCGSGETEALAWLKSQGVDAIVADHHRLSPHATEASDSAFAWIHPGAMTAIADTYAPAAPDLVHKGAGTAVADTYAPAGCVMAFKLAQALLISFLGAQDRERLDYFLFDHLDLLSLGILGDRVPLTGENRIFVWHGLRRLAQTRKGGMNALLRFFRLLPRDGAISVREATWQIIPMLNAAGRLGQPQCAAKLMLTEEPWTARECIDTLLDLNKERRSAQQKSLEAFDRVIAEQCAVDTDAVLVAMAEGLEPAVTGLAAQSLVRKYGRPVFLFVSQGAHYVGSARGTSEVDLYAWVEEQRELVVKFGGHQGAVGLTVRKTDFDAFRERLREAGKRLGPACGEIAPQPEAMVAIREADDAWWNALQRLEPFGPGFPCPLFELTGVESIRPATRQKTAGPVTVVLEGQGCRHLGEFEIAAPFALDQDQPGPWIIIAHAVPARKAQQPVFKWMIQEVKKAHA